VRLDAIISLAGLASESADAMLHQVLSDTNQHPELRAAAAWGLGEAKDRQPCRTSFKSSMTLSRG